MLRFAVSLLALWCIAAASFASPVDIKAAYKISRSGILIAQVSEHFKRDANSYTIVSESRPDGVLGLFFHDTLKITSEGRITPAGLQPLKYEFSRASDGSKTILATFNWDINLLKSEYDGKTQNIALEPGTQDRLSIMYQFMLSLPRTNEVRAWMTNGKKVEQYVYHKQGDVALKTPAGDFDAVHYQRDAKPGEDKAQLWLAKDRFFLPVRILFEDRNGILDQTLVTLSTQ
jgi:hypothetical protein